MVIINPGIFFKKISSYVLIENFTNLSDFTMDARLTDIRYFHNRPGICGLIFFGVSYLTSLSIRIAAKMYLASFPIKGVSSYKEAIILAIDLLTQDRQEGCLPLSGHKMSGSGVKPVSEIFLPGGIRIQSDPS